MRQRKIRVFEAEIVLRSTVIEVEKSRQRDSIMTGRDRELGVRSQAFRNGRGFQFATRFHRTGECPAVCELLLSQRRCYRAQVQAAQIAAKLIPREIPKRDVTGELSAERG